MSRRAILAGLAAATSGAPSPANAVPSKIDIVLAASNLGLRPLGREHEPGAWQAPAVLMAAGLREQLAAANVVTLARPHYQVEAQAGTRIRNGQSIRRFSFELAQQVRRSIDAHQFPVVVGGDCSVLLGALYGARLGGARGLIHIDGHSDFSHPRNYDAASRLGSVAGMDLALATGRGESLLTEWPGIEGPLARDEDIIQIGDRNALDANYSYADIRDTAIARFIIQDVLRAGVAAIARTAIERLSARRLEHVWMHVDLDVLSASQMPAVDSPGEPGLSFAQLSDLIARLVETRRVIGMTVTIYDPDVDPNRAYAPPIVQTLARGLRPLGGAA